MSLPCNSKLLAYNWGAVGRLCQFLLSFVVLPVAVPAHSRQTIVPPLIRSGNATERRADRGHRTESVRFQSRERSWPQLSSITRQFQETHA